MKEIIKKIFRENNFRPTKKDIDLEDNIFFEKENKEYFLVSEYSEEDIMGFFESEKTNTLINIFDKIKEDKKNGDIKKNTSLIILLKLDDLKKLEEDEKLKNKIFQIEEDEYFFRKYIIPYTDESIIKLTDFDFTEESLSEKIMEDGGNKFDDFQGKGSVSTNEDVHSEFKDAEYFLIMQMFIKIPFLSFKQNNENNKFITIKEEVDKNLDTKQKELKKNILDNNLNEKIENIPESDYLSGVGKNNALDTFTSDNLK